MTTTLTRLQTIVGEHLGIEPDKITSEADFVKDLGAESLDVVELVLAIEEEFDIDIEDKAASQIKTVQDALHYLELYTDET